MYKQLSKYFDHLLFPSKSGVRFQFRVLCRIYIRKFQRSNRERENKLGALLITLLKVFDCIDHKLLISKLYFYGISHDIVKIISPYLKIEHNGPKLMTALVIDQLFNTGFHKVQFWVHYFLALI